MLSHNACVVFRLASTRTAEEAVVRAKNASGMKSTKARVLADSSFWLAKYSGIGPLSLRQSGSSRSRAPLSICGAAYGTAPTAGFRKRASPAANGQLLPVHEQQLSDLFAAIVDAGIMRLQRALTGLMTYPWSMAVIRLRPVVRGEANSWSKTIRYHDTSGEGYRPDKRQVSLQSPTFPSWRGCSHGLELTWETDMKSTAAKKEISEITESAPSLEAGNPLGYIATAAYYKAEARGFMPGQELDDWLEAESEHS